MEETVDSPTTPSPKSESAIKSFVSGGFGGVCCVLVGHPFDLIKVRMQAGVGSSTQASAGVFSTLQKTFGKEGVRGLYRGVSAPITATSPMFAVSFWGFDMGKRIVRMASSEEEEQEGELTIPQLCAAGALSAFPTVAIMAPSERIKCLLQMQQQSSTSATAPKYKGMLDCAQQLYREGGIRSIYKGTFATLLRDVPGAIAYFGVYEVLKREIMSYQQQRSPETEQQQLSPVAVLTAGGLAGTACWTVSIPADVLKSRYQTAPEHTYKGGLVEVYQTLIRQEGYGALFRGIRPALIRAFPANAAAFMGMEVSKSLMSCMDQ